MALPSSGYITIAQIAAELGISATGLNLNDSRVRALAGRPSGVIYMSDLWGKSNYTPISGSVSSVSASAGTLNGAGSVSAFPACSVSGGSGNYRYAWSFVTQAGCSLGSTTSSTCQVSHSFANRSSGQANARVQCTVTDNVTGSTFTASGTATLQWGTTY